MSDRIVELDIDDLAFDGKSVAHLDGKVVFLDAGLPGERVRAEITQNKPRYNVARVQQIIAPGPDRVPPPCSHFDECGGCTWQDLDYRRQLHYKHRQVVESVARLGGLKDVAVADVIPSGEIFRYRNKMEFSFHAAADGRFTLGLHRRGRFDEIFNLQACHLQSDTANRIVEWVRDFVATERLPVYDVLNHVGYMRFLVIRETKRSGQIMVNLVTNSGDFPSEDRLVESLCAAFPEITTIVHCINSSKSNIATAETEKVLYGPGYIEEVLMDRTFRISASSFFQTNSLQAEVLYRTAFDLLKPQPSDTVLDLYCGTGTIGILLASKVERVTGVELVPDAVVMARGNAERNRVTNIDFVAANTKDFLLSYAEDTLPEGLANVVVIDPPRAGLHPKVLKRIIKLDPEKLLYISCNPATFARDAATLVAEGYRLSDIHPVDMFPHTKHIELTAAFFRE